MKWTRRMLEYYFLTNLMNEIQPKYNLSKCPTCIFKVNKKLEKFLEKSWKERGKIRGFQ